MDEPAPADPRRLHRLYVDVLVTDAQVALLHEVIGEALCAAPFEHDGPCRIAWSMGRLDSRDADHDGSAGWTPQGVAEAAADLRPVQVWCQDDVARSLGLAAREIARTSARDLGGALEHRRSGARSPSPRHPSRRSTGPHERPMTSPC